MPHTAAIVSAICLCTGNLEGRVGLIWLYLSDNTSWITSNNMESRYVLGHHASCTNGHTPSNSDTRKHNHASSEPAILPYRNGRPEFRTLHAIAEEWIQRMCGSIEGTAGTNQGAGSDSDSASIKKCAIEIDINTFTEPTRISNWLREGRRLDYLRFVP
jgi:hypothetical protein